jgi:hypothetical protein
MGYTAVVSILLLFFYSKFSLIMTKEFILKKIDMTTVSDQLCLIYCSREKYIKDAKNTEKSYILSIYVSKHISHHIYGSLFSDTIKRDFPPPLSFNKIKRLTFTTEDWKSFFVTFYHILMENKMFIYSKDYSLSFQCICHTFLNVNYKNKERNFRLKLRFFGLIRKNFVYLQVKKINQQKSLEWTF